MSDARKVRLEVDTQTCVRFLVVVSAFVGVVFLVWRLWPALVLILLSAFLALALNAPVSRLARQLPGRSRVAATATSFILVLGILGFFVYIALPPLIEQTAKLVNALPDYVEQASRTDGWFSQIVNKYQLHNEVDQVILSAQNQSSRLASTIGSSLVTGLSSIFTAFLAIITVLVLTFLMLVEGPRWIGIYWRFYKDKKMLEDHKRVVAKLYRVVTGFVNGQVLVAAIAAISSLVVFSILAYFFNMPVGVILPLVGMIFITSLVPMIGATIGAIIAAIVIAFSDFGASAVFLIYYFVYQQVENNLIVPIVQSKKVAVTPLSVFLAFIVGFSLLGLLGGLLAVPIVGGLRVIVLDYLENRKHSSDN